MVPVRRYSLPVCKALARVFLLIPIALSTKYQTPNTGTVRLLCTMACGYSSILPRAHHRPKSIVLLQQLQNMTRTDSYKIALHRAQNLFIAVRVSYCCTVLQYEYSSIDNRCQQQFCSTDRILYPWYTTTNARTTCKYPASSSSGHLTHARRTKSRQRTVTAKEEIPPHHHNHVGSPTVFQGELQQQQLFVRSFWQFVAGGHGCV